MDKQYLYDAFISYRHIELDSFIAQTLHKYLENVKYPINKLERNKHKVRKSKISRIFRDKDELVLNPDLAETIMEALKNSEFLIVICSPQLKESEWCKKELNTFIEMHGRERVLAVLAEGEPKESIPEELLCAETTFLDESGNVAIASKRVEPMAADVRGKTQKEIKKRIKAEVLRIAAAIFGCSYDELKQRHRERKIKKIIASTLVLGGVGIVFGIVASAMALTIRQQNITINEQYRNALINNALIQSKLSAGYLEEGRRIEAIETAVNVLGVEANNEMPYLPEVEYVLANSMYTYKMGEWEIARTLETKDNISFIKVSPKGKRIVAKDISGILYVWEASSGKLVYEIKCSSIWEEEILFVGEEAVFYKNEYNNAVVYDFSKEKIRFNVEVTDWFGDGFYCEKTNSIILAEHEGIRVIDAERGEEKNLILYPKDDAINIKISLNSDENNFWVMNKKYSKSNWVAIYNINTGKLVDFYEFPEGYEIKDAILDENMMYVIIDYMDNNYEIIYSKICTFNLKNKSDICVWEYKNTESSFEQMQTFKYEEKEYIVCVTYSGYIVFDTENGEIIRKEDIEERIIYLETEDNYGIFQLFTENGRIYDILYLMDISYRYDNVLDFFEDIKLDYFSISEEYVVAKTLGGRSFQIYEYFEDKNFNKLISLDESVMDISVDMYGEYMAIEKYSEQLIMADAKEAKILWSKDMADDFCIENMLFIKDEKEQTYFVLITSEDIYLMDVLNGTVLSQYNKEENDLYGAYDYEYLCTSKDYKSIYLGGFSLKKINVENEQINITKIDGDNRLKFAAVSLDEKYIVFIDDEKQELHIGDVKSGEIHSFSEELNVAYIDKILWPAESEFFYIVYEDHKIELFHYKNGIIKREKKIGVLESNVDNYFVAENGIYEVITGSFGESYILKEKGIVAKIDSKIAVDFYSNRIYIANGEEIYSINIYSTEELYDEAVKILGQ